MASIAKQSYSNLNRKNTQMDAGDRYKPVGGWREVCDRLILGSGISYITKGDDSFPVFSLPKDENAIIKLIKLYDTFIQHEIYHASKTTDVDSIGNSNDFKNGGSLFIVGNLMDLEQMRDLNIDIGFVPCPKYDENQEKYYAPSFGAEISILLKPLPEERWDNVGIIL